MGLVLRLLGYAWPGLIAMLGSTFFGWALSIELWGWAILFFCVGAVGTLLQMAISIEIRPWIKRDAAFFLYGFAATYKIEKLNARLTLYRRNPIFRKHVHQVTEYVPNGSKPDFEHIPCHHSKGVVGNVFSCTPATVSRVWFTDGDQMKAFYQSDLHYTEKEAKKLKTVKFALAVPIPTNEDGQTDWVLYCDVEDDISEETSENLERLLIRIAKAMVKHI